MVVALVVGGIVVAAAAFGAGRTGAVDYGLMVVGSLALVAYRRFPRGVLAVATVALTCYVLHAHGTAVAALPVIGAVHAAARARRRGVGALAGAVFLAGYLVAHRTGPQMAGQTLLLAGWFLCAVVTGLADANWQAYLRQTEQRALEAERTREEAALRRAGEERLRIARELHDSLTHSISIVKLQASVAVHLARKRGEEVPPALLAIQEAGSEAMRELRATLDVLRTDEPAGTPDVLVERARAAGLAVELKTTGGAHALPAAVDRAVYRIVQEALTNAARHAGRGAVVTVHIAHAAREVTVAVEDDGAADPGQPTRHGIGLTGMRERVTALGGTLRAGPRPQGGFAVRAVLPLDPSGSGPVRPGPGRDRQEAS